MTTAHQIAALGMALNGALQAAALPGTVDAGVNEEMQYAWARWDMSGALHLRAIAPLELGFWSKVDAYVAGFVKLCQTAGAAPRSLAGLIPANRWDPA